MKANYDVIANEGQQWSNSKW